MAAYFSVASLRTALGSNLTEQVDALTRPPVRAAKIDCDVLNQTVSLPYRLLPGNTPANVADNFFSTIEEVVAEVLQQAPLNSQEKTRTAVFLGSSSMDIAVSEHDYRYELEHTQPPVAMRSHYMGLIAERITQRFNLSSESYTFNSACTSAANALLFATNMIEAGLIDNALVVATEFFNHTTALGFNSLDLLSARGIRPFENKRSGLELGEACGALLLSRADHRGCGQHLLGGANICDRYSISTANPDGSTVASVINRALTSAQLNPPDIKAIKAHGTASMTNDEAEAAGMHAAFPTLPPVTALKPFIGHTLGACGLAETILFCEALGNGFLVPVEGISAVPGSLNVTLNQTPLEAEAGAYMLNFFGFGGNNTSLIINHDRGVQ